MRPFFVLLVLSLAAPAEAEVADTWGKDHPLIRPYAGSKRVDSLHHNYESMRFPVKERVEHFFGKVPKSITVEGAITRLVYNAPPNRSALEVFRNYREELSRAGFEPVTAGAEDRAYSATRFLNALGVGDTLWYCHTYEAPASHYLLTQKKTAQGTATVAVFTAECGADRPTFKGVRTILWIVESKPMERNQVAVDADALWRAMEAEGTATLHGIEFDFDQAKLRSESEPVLKEAAKLLATHPTLKLYVVGHTDRQGTFDYNLKLSRDRAAAVVQWLETKGAVAKGRLAPHGVGVLAPKGTNGTEAGRALNRRVELVVQ